MMIYCSLLPHSLHISNSLISSPFNISLLSPTKLLWTLFSDLLYSGHPTWLSIHSFPVQSLNRALQHWAATAEWNMNLIHFWNPSRQHNYCRLIWQWLRLIWYGVLEWAVCVEHIHLCEWVCICIVCADAWIIFFSILVHMHYVWSEITFSEMCFSRGF